MASRSLYRVLGGEHVRHRREASPAVVLQRLLSLDYVVERPPKPWLATEAESVSALTAARAPEEALLQRVYGGRRDSRTRYFAHKLPAALGERATFVFVQAEDMTPSSVRTWGETHAALWTALRSAGRAVEVVGVGRDPERLAVAEPVLAGWTTAPALAAEPERSAEPDGTARAEFAEIQAAVARGDLAGLEQYGGINGPLARMRDLSATAAGTGRARPAITSGRT